MPGGPQDRAQVAGVADAVKHERERAEIGAVGNGRRGDDGGDPLRGDGIGDRGEDVRADFENLGVAQRPKAGEERGAAFGLRKMPRLDKRESGREAGPQSVFDETDAFGKKGALATTLSRLVEGTNELDALVRGARNYASAPLATSTSCSKAASSE